ncbi:MAG: futalosine hydrolase [Saprospiraceae bacterium]|nr:futalosine hydrolase [Saprospiraceae bacterium]
MQILLVAATPFEIAPTLEWLEQNFSRTEHGSFQLRRIAVFPLVTGPGAVATCWHIARFLEHHPVSLALNAGIAGALDRSLAIGNVLNVTTERFADLGVQEADGRFTDLFELGLVDADTRPFSGGELRNPAGGQATFLPEAQGITVNKVHGEKAAIEAIREKYPEAQIESMEGAAFFYACLSGNIPFVEIRSISNYVEPRNREAWNLPLAIGRLNETLQLLLESLDDLAGK